MITKEVKKVKSCLFCASDYHLEMLIIPYICKKIENEEFFVITQDNLEKPYTYTNKTDKRLHVVNELGDYKVNFDNELPARTNSLANALIIDTNLYPNLPLRKSINA